MRQLLGPEGGPGSLQVGPLPESKPSSSSTPGCLATVRPWLVFNRTFSALRRGPSLLSVTSGDFRMMVASMILLIRAIKIKSILVKGVREMNHTSSVVLTHSFQSVASTRWPVSLASRPTVIHITYSNTLKASLFSADMLIRL